MNNDLLECKRKAQDLVVSNEAPRNKNGKKKGYIEVMALLWEEKGYKHLGIKSQNLRDQASRLEKIREANNSTASITKGELFDENSISQNSTRNTQEDVFDKN